MKKIILKKGKNLGEEVYEIYKEQSRERLIRLAKDDNNGSNLPVIDDHYLIEEYHELGGGSGGWDSYSKIIGISHGKEELPKKLYECALFSAKQLAKHAEAQFVDETQKAN